MKKDFNNWNEIKKKTEYLRRVDNLYFREREIWWCRIGLNIGFEQDGRGEQFTRPIVIVKKYNPQTFLAIPLSTTKKQGKYYLPIGKVEEKKATAILSQIRLLDSHRLVSRIGTMKKETFLPLIEKVVDVNFDDYKQVSPA